MTEDAQEKDLRAAEYALGVMSADERAAFEAEMATDRALRESVRFWDESLTPMTSSVEPEPVPPRVYRRLEKRLFESRAPLLVRVGFWRGVSFAALAAAATFALIAFSEPELGAGPTLVAQVSGEAGVTVAALYDPADRALRINRVAGAAAEGRALELWLIVGDAAPLSLGVLPEEAQGTLVLTDLPITDGILAISDEPQGGSPTGAPTGDVLAIGAFSEI
jgi:anti-sigma-K factor RskA